MIFHRLSTPAAGQAHLRQALTLAAALTLTACSPSREEGAVAWGELVNPSAFERINEPVYFSFRALGLHENNSQPIAVRAGGSVLPGQIIDSDGDGAADGLLALADFKAGAKLKINIVTDADAVQAASAGPKRTQAELSRKTGGQWEWDKELNHHKYVGGRFENVRRLTPPAEHTDHSEFIRYEGPGIESDLVGYRIYLDWRNGFDIFGKKTREMALQNTGQDGFESYHHMADWGMDILKVGAALGIGGFGYWNEGSGKVERVSQLDGWDASILEDGNIYSALKIRYKGWRVAGRKVDLDARLSMTAGSRLVHVNLESSEELPNLALGIVKHPGTVLLTGDMNVTGQAWTWIASWGRQSLSGDDDQLGMAILFRREALDAQADDGLNYLAVAEPSNKKLEYYFLAAWELEPAGITSQQAFVEYLNREAERLTMPSRRSLDSALNGTVKTFPLNAQSALDWGRRLADSELQTTLMYAYGGFDAMRRRPAYFEYTTGLLAQAYDDLARAGQARYAKVAEQVIGSFVADDGTIRTYDESKYNMDSINSGKVLLRLYEATHQGKYKTAAAQLRHQLQNHPRTGEGAFWHKQRYPHQLWLDGVYMGMPFLAQYAALFESGAGQDASFKEAVNEFEIVRRHLRDAGTGLYYHGWDEKQRQDWANRQTGLSSQFWSRGLGWYAMALVDVLDYIPGNKTELRKPLLEIIAELAPAIVKAQDGATGLWYQIPDRPGERGNYPESSGSAMFVYMLAKAVNKGYLPESYKKNAIKGYEGMVRGFVEAHADGSFSLTGACSVAGLGFGRDGSYRYYMSEPIVDNDPKAVGPFIMAGIQVSQLLQ
ncbi:MAG TPA: glycoside hydrolase family 88 protein [Gammaproteobacteria bacterium]|nr:glycoside hydrolase family 88 protein [Gammaproteobacteria bacterium]